MHYYKRNIGDYAKRTGRLTMLEHGAYTLLHDACYDRERFPTMEEAIEWSWARTDDEIKAVQFVLSRFFVLEDGVYVHKEMQAEIDKYRENAEKNRHIATEREKKRKETSRNVNEACTKRERSVNENDEIDQDRAPNQEPLTINQEPETKNQEPVAATAVAAPARRRSATSSAKNHSATSATWAAYSSAFVNRYGTEPVRNAKVNGILANLVKRIGEDDAPHVAGFFVGHNDSFYVRRMHSVDMLLNSCEALHAQWKTGREMTNRKAQEVERMGFEFVSHHDDGEIF